MLHLTYHSVLQCKCLDPDYKAGSSCTGSCGAPGYKGDGNCDDNNKSLLRLLCP